LHTFV